MNGSSRFGFKKVNYDYMQPICPITATTLAEAWEELARQKKITVQEAQAQYQFQLKKPYMEPAIIVDKLAPGQSDQPALEAPSHPDEWSMKEIE